MNADSVEEVGGENAVYLRILGGGLKHGDIELILDFKIASRGDEERFDGRDLEAVETAVICGKDTFVPSTVGTWIADGEIELEIFVVIDMVNGLTEVVDGVFGEDV